MSYAGFHVVRVHFVTARETFFLVISLFLFHTAYIAYIMSRHNSSKATSLNASREQTRLARHIHYVDLYAEYVQAITKDIHQ